MGSAGNVPENIAHVLNIFRSPEFVRRFSKLLQPGPALVESIESQTDVSVYSHLGYRYITLRMYWDYILFSLTGLTSDLVHLVLLQPVALPSPIPALSMPALDDNISFDEIPAVQYFLYVSEFNNFSLYHCYSTKPKQDLKDCVGSSELCDTLDLNAANAQQFNNPLQDFGLHAAAKADPDLDSI